MSSEASPGTIDSLLMPPPPKRLRDDTELQSSEELLRTVEFSMHHSDSRVSSQHASCSLDATMRQGDVSCGIDQQQEGTGAVSCMPETINFVTPPKTDAETPSDTRDETTNYSDNDSMQSERSTVIAESVSSDNHGRRSMPETTTTRFSDIIGHASVKLRIDEMLLPLALPPALADSILTGVRSLPACLLLYGPPGCGKTQLARAIAGEARAAYISVGPSDILSKFVGESEQSVRSIFQKAYNDAKKMDSMCTVLFFDEIDALGHSRGASDMNGSGQSNETDGCSRRVLAELLIQLTLLSAPSSDDKENDFYSCNGSSGYALGERNDKHSGQQVTQQSQSDEYSLHRQTTPTLKPRVIVVAATNRPEDCDPALLRRFSIRANVDLPTKRDRRKIISKFLSEFDHTITKAQLNELAGATEGWSGCDLESLTREAAMAPIRECLRSAAMLKRRARKMEQQGGDESAQGVKQPKPLDAEEEARETLMRDFRQLRPVTLVDFDEAIEFWLGNQQTSSSLAGSMNSKRKQVHYDSTSSSEDEED